MTILLVDDDEDDRLIFELAVREVNSSIIVKTTSDGSQLLNLLTDAEETRPDILFLDLNMMRKNGKECLQEIRSRKELDHLPVVIYSTSATQKDINDTYTMGANFYLIKSNDFASLKRILAKVFTDTKNRVLHPVKEEFVYSTPE